MKSHINVSVDTRMLGGKIVDLRIPTEQMVGDLLHNIAQTLHLKQPADTELTYLKIANKDELLAADDYLDSSAISDGDLITLVVMQAAASGENQINEKGVEESNEETNN